MDETNGQPPGSAGERENEATRPLAPPEHASVPPAESAPATDAERAARRQEHDLATGEENAS